MMKELPSPNSRDTIARRVVAEAKLTRNG